MNWIIHIIGNGVPCGICGKIENIFPRFICNAHTHGMAQYAHPDFQLVLHMSDADIGFILNTLGLRVKAGERFRSGDFVEGIFEDCRIRLDEAESNGHRVLRVIIPDSKNRFPEDANCEYPYNHQLIPTDELEKLTGGCSDGK